MTSMIKYELKKIFQSKIFLVVFFLALIGMILFTTCTLNQYRTGVRGTYHLSDSRLREVKIAETFVSEANISELRAELTAFESNDAIYEDHKTWQAEHPQGGSVYFGKYEGTATPDYEPPLIRDEYLAEYLKLYCPVKEYDQKTESLKMAKESARQYEKTSESYQLEIKNIEKIEKTLKEGFVVGYDYGWENIYDTFSSQIGILLGIVVVFGLCGVFTGEYASGADALLLSSKRGRTKATGAKIIASLLYATICWAIYTAMTIVVSFAFLGTEGANVGDIENNIERLPGVCLSILLGAVLLALITLAVSAAFSKQLPSIAAAALLGLLPAVNDMMYSDASWVQLINALPIKMIFGSYANSNCYVFFNNTLFDLRVLFLPVAAVTAVVTLPLIYTLYCRHQVKN